MGKHRGVYWVLGLAAAVVLCLALLPVSGPDREKKTISILPTEATAGSLCACRFQSTEASGQNRMLYVERWQGGERTEQILLTALDDTGIYSVQVMPALEEKLVWSAVWDGQAAVAETSQPSGCVYSALTQEALDGWEGEDDLILLCIGFGDLEQGLPAIDCLTLMTSPEHVKDYQEVQLLRIK